MLFVDFGQIVFDFEVVVIGNYIFCLSDYWGKNFVIYFYFKDNMLGCIIEGQDFCDCQFEFDVLNMVIFGVFWDGFKVYENFWVKYDFLFYLILDKDEVVCKLFDVIKFKKFYGKEYLGIECSIFLIDFEGKLCNVWCGVKVKGYVDEVFVVVWVF